MSVNIITTSDFRRAAKKLLKKYHSLKSELVELQKDLKQNPTMGTLLTEDIYKIRLAVKSKGKGKSGGLRIITFVHLQKEEDGTINVYLLSVYDKSEYQNISESIIKEIVLEIKEELDATTNSSDEEE